MLQSETGSFKLPDVSLWSLYQRVTNIRRTMT